MLRGSTSSLLRRDGQAVPLCVALGGAAEVAVLPLNHRGEAYEDEVFAVDTGNKRVQVFRVQVLPTLQTDVHRCYW